MALDIIPVLLALLASFLFALGGQFQNMGLPYMNARAGATITITGAAALFLLTAPFFLDFDLLFHPAVLIFVLVGLFRPALSANLALAGMRYLGPTLSTTLTSTTPLFGTALGILWLGEALTASTAAGTLAIVLAVALLVRRDKKAALDWPLWALALPVGAAALRATGHALSKIGMEQVPDPYLASMVGFVVSAILTRAIQQMRRNPEPIPWRGRGARWFLGASCCFSLAIVALNAALMTGKLVDVVPIVAASPVFTLIMSLLIFRRERITARIVAAVALVVPAVIVIAVKG